MVKLTVTGFVLMTIEVSFAKLRLIRNVDFITAAIVLAVLGAVSAVWGL
jgi:formate hydrogenlyase subunit 4